MDPTSNNVARAISPVKAPRKRKRIVISCTECHRRKQKCDRASPCSNCVARSKESLCHYENEAARKAQLLEENGTSNEDGGLYRVIKPVESGNEAQISAFGYTKANGSLNTTLGIFKKIENHDNNVDPLIESTASSSGAPTGLREKYKSYIRQLPSKQHVEKLLVAYFRESNFQYYPLDEGIFRDQLKDWYSIPFSTLNKGPSELPADMQFFPALLFQTLALGLQFQPPDYDKSLDTLKYAAGMTFDDLSSDYSEASCQILCLLGKRNTTLTTVQAGFLRVSYLKNCGMIPESWHYLSQTIRDAQEIGLHKDNNQQRTRRPDEKPEDILENLWIQQLRRRMWLILCLWDIHMGIVLGRPTSVDSRDGRPPFPIDAPIPKNRRVEAPNPRTEADPPTPLTMLLWTAELCAPLWDIYNLEKEDPHQNDFARVENMHKLIEQISLHCPPFFRSQNPDTTFDHLDECHWLPRARPYHRGNAAFTLMVLHRPYIFTNSASRTAALKAALEVLAAQRELFDLLTKKHYKLFYLVLATFDAIVLGTAIFILHPYENPDYLDDTLQHFEWGMERFHIMSARNSMAKSALSVLKAIYVRLKRALNQPMKTPKYLHLSNSASTPESYVDPALSQALPTPITHASISSASSNTNTTNTANSHSTTITDNSNKSAQYLLPATQEIKDEVIPSTSAAWEAFSGGTMSLPPNFDFNAIAPLQPTHDLVFNDLGGSIGSGIDYPPGNALQIPQVDGPWQFEGDFGNDSFWGFMNNYNP